VFKSEREIYGAIRVILQSFGVLIVI